MNKRHTEILNYINEHGKTEVGVLSEIFHTSKVTIRKDLTYLAEQGMLKRERGYAVPVNPGDINYQLAQNYETKLQIAQTAASYIKDGECLVIESGSTCALLAKVLGETKRGITIITNCVYIADYVQQYTNMQIILLGGTLQRRTMSLVGPLTKSAIQSFHADKIFVGTDGYSRTFGFTGNDLSRSDTLSAMIAACEHTYVLTTSAKFDEPGAVTTIKLEDVDYLITDSGIPQSEAEFMTEMGIHVVLADRQ